MVDCDNVSAVRQFHDMRLGHGLGGEIVGKTFRKLLTGDIAIRIADVSESQPLEFVEV